MKIRANFFLSFFFISTFFTLYSCSKRSSENEIRIGIQKTGPLVYLKDQKILEEFFKDKNLKVKWIEFSSGPPMIEALNVGGIDFCTTGETPPIFAQSAGAKFYYIANEPNSPKNEGIIVPKNSTIKSLSDLKGKKVAFSKGSSANYAVAGALQKANLKFSDIESVYLQPSDARSAFESNKIDAWSIWEPYLSEAIVNANGKLIEDDLKPNLWFFLGSKKYCDQNPNIIKSLIDQIKLADKEILKDKSKFAKILSKINGLDVVITQSAVDHENFGVEPISKETIEKQQEAANIFYDLKLIPNRINVSDLIWNIK